MYEATQYPEYYESERFCSSCKSCRTRQQKFKAPGSGGRPLSLTSNAAMQIVW